MKLVFLDASTLDRGDIDFSALAAEGDLRAHPLTSAAEAPSRCAGAEVVISNKVPVGKAVIDAAPELRLVVSAATGVNQIDLAACQAAGIAVANVAGYSTESVAQHTFALILELATRAGTISSTVRTDWPASPIFTRLDHPLFELHGRTLGIVGFGGIGRAVARVGRAFGMEIIALSRDGARPGEVPRLPADEFFATADVVSLHCPLTAETERMIDAERLASMKPGALLINTGRGPLIDEPALAAALRSGHLGGAGLDVLSVEPPPADHPLLAPDIPNLIITPHTAWSTREARRRLLGGIVADIRSFKEGGRLNRIV
ncbi:D-2-hydroxyacid dehydrogenase [Haloferula sargassicola]|uniref:2-hydroxyacid dehydrogenase HI_1556 n=1 Tax=Haloferula sargassicola TaxID=490096 RepID=A0ABP9UMU8_9BACT